MPSTQVEIVGLSRLQKALANYPKIAHARLQDAIVASAAEVVSHATRENVPWRTGNLVQSFGQGVTMGELFARVGPNASQAPYAIFVHDGTQHIKNPNRFMPRIVGKAQPRINQHFEKAEK